MVHEAFNVRRIDIHSRVCACDSLAPSNAGILSTGYDTSLVEIALVASHQ
jgi:hypothetical protein